MCATSVSSTNHCLVGRRNGRLPCSASYLSFQLTLRGCRVFTKTVGPLYRNRHAPLFPQPGGLSLKLLPREEEPGDEESAVAAAPGPRTRAGLCAKVSADVRLCSFVLSTQLQTDALRALIHTGGSAWFVCDCVDVCVSKQISICPVMTRYRAAGDFFFLSPPFFIWAQLQFNRVFKQQEISCLVGINCFVRQAWFSGR